ncbi:MAG TPA: pyridoxine 5'-phosphate synthase [Gammaproteobacteria bacterium]|nr:pyridoxine 5'-phosphate synthase [Gammaproteobacteria bacterium]
MKTKLSVNLNKVALIRNSRDTVIPSVVDAAITAIKAGVSGITVHPRPDMRHIRPDDVYDLTALLSAEKYGHIEFNIEGNPYAGPEANGYPGFMELVREVKPHQATLVPDDPKQLTSDHGWDLTSESNQLKPLVADLQERNIRVSLFMDPDESQLELAARLGVDRIEFYTGPYADHYGTSAQPEILESFSTAGQVAHSLGLGINAGHDLNQDNLATFCQAVIPVAEVSIGHAIISDALWLGLEETVSRYNKILNDVEPA